MSFLFSLLLSSRKLSFPPMRKVNPLTFSYSASRSLKHHKTTLQNPQELQHHRKPQQGLPKETPGEKGCTVQEIRMQQLSESISQDCNGWAATNQSTRATPPLIPPTPPPAPTTWLCY